jgi:uncharacterized damage-inducible protein DinB
MTVAVGEAFVHRSRAYLTKDYMPKIRKTVEGLAAGDLWWRPNDASNSVGNLLLHLAGNIRQWVLSGVGGAKDSRDRDLEFQQDGGATAEELLDHLEATVLAVDAVLADLPTSSLLDTRVIQGMEVTVLEAVYHVVEHFSTHTGQIVYLAKLRSGKDLEFWKVEGGKAVPNW